MGTVKQWGWFLGMLGCFAVGIASAGEQPTTPTSSLSDELSNLLRQRLAPYQPLAEQLRKRSVSELQKLGQWEYKVIAAKTSDTAELSAMLNLWGEQGWECFHVVSSAPAGPGSLPTDHLLFFRKHKGSWLSQIPIGDLLRLLLYFASESGQTATEPQPMR